MAKIDRPGDGDLPGDAVPPVDQLVRESLEVLTVQIERGDALTDPESLKLLMRTLQAVSPLARRRVAGQAQLAAMRRRRGELLSADQLSDQEQCTRARARLLELRTKFPKLSKSKAKVLIAREMRVKAGRITRYLTES